jgi:hypothetical protein
MLHPASLWVDLFVLHLIDADHLSCVVKDHEARAGRTLIHCR